MSQNRKFKTFQDKFIGGNWKKKQLMPVQGLHREIWICWKMLCISTREWVLCTTFAGRNYLFQKTEEWWWNNQLFSLLIFVDVMLIRSVFEMWMIGKIVVSFYFVKSGSRWLIFFLIDLKIPIFDLKWLFSQSRCSYQISQFGDVQFFK